MWFPKFEHELFLAVKPNKHRSGDPAGWILDSIHGWHWVNYLSRAMELTDERPTQIQCRRLIKAILKFRES